jgi:hypothetical protein
MTVDKLEKYCNGDTSNADWEFLFWEESAYAVWYINTGCGKDAFISILLELKKNPNRKKGLRECDRVRCRRTLERYTPGAGDQHKALKGKKID